jgi:hypothetical protein
MLFAYTVDAYNLGVTEFNRFVNQVDAYIGCIIEEGESDLKRLPGVISDGIRKDQVELLDEVRRLRSQLELSRSTLR